jgi:hypothetical protein
MALIKRDRSFDDILNDVVMNELPVKFIATVNVVLNNGSSIVFEGSDLEGLDDIDTILKSEELQEYKDMIVDVQITMDSDLLKKSVTKHVASLLAKHFGEAK